jgi:hypothetical protein
LVQLSRNAFLENQQTISRVRFVTSLDFRNDIVQLGSRAKHPNTLPANTMPQTIPATNGNADRPKVLIPEKVSPDGLALLQASLDVHERKGLSPDDLLQIIGDYDALIVRSETKVNAALLAAGKKLRVVARAGVGVDNVDLDAATKLGIIVVNSPQGNINAAAEHTIALLMVVMPHVWPKVHHANNDREGDSTECRSSRTEH